MQVQWKLGVAHSTRERQRERNTKIHYFQNNALTQCTFLCVQCTRFIQVLTRTDRSTIVLQCSLRAPTQTPKYIPYGISFFASPIGPNRLGTGPNRSVHTDSVLGFFSRPEVEFVIQLGVAVSSAPFLLGCLVFRDFSPPQVRNVYVTQPERTRELPQLVQTKGLGEDVGTY